jgi:ketosteroid isomerase-like protein
MPRTRSKLQAAALGGTPDEVESLFYEGLRNGDVEKVMSCWADEDDIVCIHPGGMRLLGVASIRATFEEMFSNGGALQVTAFNVRRVDAVASAVHHVTEQVDVQTDRGNLQAYVLATNVYIKTAQGWRMVVHHASPGTEASVQEDGNQPKVLH